MIGKGRFDVEGVRRRIRTSRLWNEIVYRRQIGSTNDLAKRLALAGAPEGTVVVADEQTAGRGRLDRRWIAPPRTGLLCSILFRPDLTPPQVHRLTMICSLAAAQAIEELSRLPVVLKWPNDILTTSRSTQGGATAWRKLAGILTESELFRDKLRFVIVGVGINVSVPRERLTELAPDATSILAETGRDFNRSDLLIRLLEATEERYGRLRQGDSQHQEWSARLVTLGHRVGVRTAQGAFDGIAETVDDNGALLVRTDDGCLRTVVAGDVTLAQG